MSGLAHHQPVFVQHNPVPHQHQVHMYSTPGGNNSSPSQLAVYQPTSFPMQPYALSTLPADLLPTYQQSTQMPENFHQQSQPFAGQHSGTVSYLPAANGTAAPASDMSHSTAVSEVRQQGLEVRLSLDRINEKIDRAHEKVSSLSHGGNALSLPNTTMTMEASALMYSVQRIIQENEQLKKELLEKSTKIDNQNAKIAELIQDNQRSLEQSNSWLEQRNDGYKSTASQIQGHVLTLEQDKLKLTTELSSVTSQLSISQMELATMKKQEQEIRQQRDALLADVDLVKAELSKLRLVHSDDEKQVQQMTGQLKEERQARRQLDTQLTATQDELMEMRRTRDALEKAVIEKRQKQAEEKRQWEEELERIKIRYENEFTQLKDKLRAQRSSIDLAAAEKISSMEAEITREWKEKCERVQAAAQNKLQRGHNEWLQERQVLESKMAEQERKVTLLKQQLSEADVKIASLSEEVEIGNVYKNKFEALRSQALIMRDKYEKSLMELETQCNEAEGRRRDVEEQLARTVEQAGCARLAVSSMEERLQATQHENAMLSDRLVAERERARQEELQRPNVTVEIKKVMNSVYQSVVKKLDSEKRYKGARVQEKLLNIIKSTTLRLLGQHVDEQSSEESEEESEEENVEVNEVASQTKMQVKQVEQVSTERSTATKEEIHEVTGDAGNDNSVEKSRNCSSPQSMAIVDGSLDHRSGDDVKVAAGFITQQDTLHESLLSTDNQQTSDGNVSNLDVDAAAAESNNVPPCSSENEHPDYSSFKQQCVTTETFSDRVTGESNNDNEVNTEVVKSREDRDQEVPSHVKSAIEGSKKVDILSSVETHDDDDSNGFDMLDDLPVEYTDPETQIKQPDDLADDQEIKHSENFGIKENIGGTHIDTNVKDSTVDYQETITPETAGTVFDRKISGTCASGLEENNKQRVVTDPVTIETSEPDVDRDITDSGHQVSKDVLVADDDLVIETVSSSGTQPEPTLDTQSVTSPAETGLVTTSETELVPTSETEPVTTSETELVPTSETEPVTTSETKPTTTSETEPMNSAAELVTELWSQPVTTLEAKPVTASNTEPMTTSDTEPVTTSDTEPVTTSDTEPATTSDPEPVTTSDTELVTTSDTEPVTTSEIEPVTTSEIEPETTSETKPVTTSETKPTTTSETEPMNSAAELVTELWSQPVTTLEAKPVTALNTEAATTSDTEPVTTSDTEPVTTSDTEPATTSDPEPVTTSDTELVTTSDTEPATTSEIEPETTSETKPVTTSETKPTTTSETEPVTTSDTEPITTSKTEPISSAAELVTELQSQPVTTLEAKPVITSNTEAATTVDTEHVAISDSELVTTAEKKPVATFDTEPVTTLETELVTTSETELVTTSKTEPMTSAAEMVTESESLSVTTSETQPVINEFVETQLVTSLEKQETCIKHEITGSETGSKVSDAIVEVAELGTPVAEKDVQQSTSATPVTPTETTSDAKNDDASFSDDTDSDFLSAIDSSPLMTEVETRRSRSAIVSDMQQSSALVDDEDADIYFSLAGSLPDDVTSQMMMDSSTTAMEPSLIEPPPITDDIADKDEDGEDLFGPSSKSRAKIDVIVPAPMSSLANRVLTEDALDTKARPPSLFPDEEDDDDNLDWLN